MTSGRRGSLSEQGQDFVSDIDAWEAERRVRVWERMPERWLPDRRPDMRHKRRQDILAYVIMGVLAVIDAGMLTYLAGR